MLSLRDFVLVGYIDLLIVDSSSKVALIEGRR